MKDEVAKKLEDLKEYIGELKNLRQIKLSELREKKIERAAIERFFQMAIESVLDMCFMIISHERLEKPDEYRKAILELEEAGVLDKKFAEKFADMAGFRNILVHQYAQVDIKELHRKLRRSLDDFDTFAKQIAKYLLEKEE